MTLAGDERYRRAHAIVHAVMDAPEAGRAVAIADACGDDAALAREVEWLIASAEVTDPESAFGRMPSLDASLLADARIESSTPHEYRLLHRLGEGGMGQVWLAERDDGGIRQRVALKRLHGVGTADEGELERFIAEGRILATLSHPNIAHLLDAGRGSDGEPFLAMQYVDGQRIDDWCETRSLGLRARVELFLKVCDAVAYAHTQLVIHRDLKPPNILVDTKGEPRLLDFGIARLIDEDAHATRTATGLRAMTLAYASPEQVEGRALGTATDIYSLGIVLYELLAGVRPFDHIDTGHARSNAIVSGEITPPSRQSRKPDAQRTGRPTLVASARRIPADVDAIVLKALRREPVQRYGSVTELADDLRRYLAAQPVRARRGQWWYRTQRYLWRNRWPVAAAAVLLAVGGGFTWRTVLAEREARAQARTSDRVADFLVSVFSAADSNVNKDLRHDLTAREVLDAGANRIHVELANEPRTRARLLEAVGNAYRHMDANNKAAELMREAADLDLDPSVDQPLAAARSLEALANIMANGEFSAHEAERAARDSLALAERLTPAGSQEIANAWMVLSLALNRAAQFKGAEAAAETSLAMNRQTPMGEDNRLAAALHNLCIITFNRGDAEGSKEYCAQALAAKSDTENLSKSMTLTKYAQFLERSDDQVGAIAAIEHALAIARRIEGEHGAFGAVYLLRDAHLLDDAGRYGEARVRLDETLADEERLNGKDSGDYAYVVLEEGRHSAVLGERDRAVALLRDAAKRMSGLYEADDPRVLYSKTLLATALLDAGHADGDVRKLLDEAMTGWSSKDDPGAVQAPCTPVALAQWFVMKGDPAAAETLLDRVDSADARSDRWVRARAGLLRAAIARQRNDDAGALRHTESVWKLLHQTIGADHPQTARIGLMLARDLRDAGRIGDAQALETELQPVFEASFPAQSAFRVERRSF
jgi:tetratricopeptide (TPR) repeat protein